MIEYFTSSGLQMKDINFATAVTLLVFDIFFLHHRDHHAITVISSCFLNNPYLYSDNRHILLGQEIYFTVSYLNVKRYTDSCARKLHLGPKTTDFFLLCIFWAFAKATSETVSII